MQNIFTYDLCSSLVQLSFADLNLAKQLWLSVFPGIWNLLDDSQREILSSKAIKFLVNTKLKNSCMATFYEALILCQPKIVLTPYVFIPMN